MANDVYRHFLIRDQDNDSIRPLDLLQGWGSPGREQLRARLPRAFSSFLKRLRGVSACACSGRVSSRQCGVR